MKWTPMIYSGPMVCALLADAKTMTRRALRTAPPPGTSWMATYHHPKEPVKGPHFWAGVNQGGGKWELLDFATTCPYGQPGDRIWVRESWSSSDYRLQRGPYLKPDDFDVIEARDLGHLIYAADGTPDWEGEQEFIRWVPSIHMPRWASRITLEITGVRVERLQDITEADAIAEGIKRYTGPLRWVRYLDAITGEPVHNTARDAFFALWVAINGQESLDANPFVWVVKFRRIP